MAVTVVLLVVGVGAVFFLLACLRGFSRAGKQEKILGLLVGPQGAGTARRKTGQPVQFPKPQNERSHATFEPGNISKNTAAVVGLAILLGSRSTGFAAQITAPPVPRNDDKIPAQKELFRGERLRHHS